MNELVVKRRHRYSGETVEIYRGKAKCRKEDNQILINYQKDDENVDLVISDLEGILIRNNKKETTKLVFTKDNSFGLIRNELGSLQLALKLHKININNNKIIIEYDITDSNGQDGYCLEFKMEE